MDGPLLRWLHLQVGQLLAQLADICLLLCLRVVMAIIQLKAQIRTTAMIAGMNA